MGYIGAIIERKDKKILFQLRDNKPNIPHPNQWSIFGGGINKREDPKDAAVRELKEELNLKLNKSNLNLLARMNSFSKTNYIYWIKMKKESKDLKLKEGISMKYMSLKKILLKRNVVSSLRLFLIIYPILRFLKK